MRKLIFAVSALLALSAGTAAKAHAFLDHADPRVGNVSVGPLHDDGHSGKRIINRSANSQFTIDARKIGRRSGKEDARDQLSRIQLAVIVPETRVELSQWNSSDPRGAGNLDFCIQAQERRRRVSRKRSPTFSSTGGDVAQVAVLLDAEAATFAPRQRLVVPQTPGVEADVAAQRSHVAQHRRSHRRRSFPPAVNTVPDVETAIALDLRSNSDWHTSISFNAHSTRE